MPLFKPYTDGDYVCSTWFERDRKHISLETPRGRKIFDLWDEDVDDAIESGFLTVPRHPRPSDTDWQPAAVSYARSFGLIKDLDDERLKRAERQQRLRVKKAIAKAIQRVSPA